MTYYYGTNTQGSKWIKKYGAIYSKCIPSWKTTTYSKIFIEICNCIGIIATGEELDEDIINKYELVELDYKQRGLVDSFLTFKNGRFI